MINVTIFRRNGVCTGFVSEGHAGYADEGSDIICAAASALMLNCVNSVESLTGTQVLAEDSEGFLRCMFPEGLDDGGRILVESMILGLSMIAGTYRDDDEPFLKISFEED